MKKSMAILCILVLMTTFVQAQTQATPQTQTREPSSATPAKSATADIVVGTELSWLVGTWKGSGVQNGVSFESTLSAEPTLDGNALLLRRQSGDNFKELMVIGFGRSSAKVIATLFDSQNHIGLFTCEIQGRKLDVVNIPSPSGANSRRTFELLSDGSLNFIISGGAAGQPVNKQLEIIFKKG